MVTQIWAIPELESAGIQLWEESGQIRFRAPKSAMTEEWRNTLHQHKEAVIDLNTALLHHFFEVPIAEQIGQIPAHTKQDDVFFYAVSL